MGEKIKRKFMAHYVGIGEEPTYTRLGADLEEYTIELNPNVETKTNILGETTTTIDSYQPQSSVEPYYAIEGDELFTWLQNCIDTRATLDDLKVKTLEVHLWEEDGTGTFVAYQEDAVVEITSYGGDTTGYQIPFNLHNTGNRVKGKFALATKTFTAE